MQFVKKSIEGIGSFTLERSHRIHLEKNFFKARMGLSLPSMRRGENALKKNFIFRPQFGRV